MAILHLELVSFRNHNKQEFNFISGLTVIWGENGSGKTAILEAIHVLSFGRSFRTHKYRELIKNKSSQLVVRGNFGNNATQDQVAVQMEKLSGIKLKLNGKSLTSRKELIGRNNVVVLSPEEQSVTKGAPIERRKFFDKMFSVTSREYVDTLQNYNRVLKQRNAVIQNAKDGSAPTKDIQSWDDQLISTGQKLWLLRFEFISIFQTMLSSVVGRYDNKILFDLIYLKEAPTQGLYKSEIINSLKKDIRLGRTTYGPHRDDISLIWDKRDLRSQGSQGEHKLSMVLLKLTEMVFIREKTGKHPTLLLDDLFAKLDLGRSKKIVSLLQGLETESGDPVQTIVTTTDLLNVEKSGLMSGEIENKTYNLKR
jgi:DNA replication and repair protein RecF